MLLDPQAKLGGSIRCWTLLTAILLAAFLCFPGCGRKVPPPAPPANPDGEDTDNGKEDGASTPSDTDHGVPLAGAELGKALYAQHCSACHGENGNGEGLAARFLFPKPRDFTAGKFRLVSTDNRIPSDGDLEAVLRRGMPGSTMPPWDHLKDEEITALIGQVREKYQAGLRELYTLTLMEDEDLSAEEIKEAEWQAEIESFVKKRTTPGTPTEVPELGAPDEAAIARGKAIYKKQGCFQCHGETGRGDGTQKMVNDEGHAMRPRDFTQGIFKGGHDVASIYRRIAFGMPGTPMPSSGANLKPEQMVDLVHYTLSLSDQEQRENAILKRQSITANVVSTLPKGASDEDWAAAKPVGIKTVPLWWRVGGEPNLQVQAVHDGKTIAVRLSWQDETNDSHAARSETFEDAVALELYQGNAEPFVGMGGSKTPVDVWFWDADRQGDLATVESVYPNTVVDNFPFSEKAVASAEISREGAKTEDQPDVSLPAKAVGNPIVPTTGGSGASSLSATGPGTVTFRLPESRLVQAQGEWASGRRTVVMTRSLAVESASDGVTLAPGSKVSIAFAIWDGSKQDRDGKKLITIWNDFELEK